MRQAMVWLGLCGALALVPTVLSAQTAQVGQVTGEVTDATGGRLPGAAVTLTSIERGFSRVGTTDAAGRFMFRVVSIGLYDVTVSLQGFQTKRVTRNLVETEKTTNLSVALAVSSLSEAITVVGEVPIVDATNQTQTTRLRSDEFSNCR